MLREIWSSAMGGGDGNLGEEAGDCAILLSCRERVEDNVV